MTDAEFEAFYERHWKYVYRLCYTYMRSSAEAEDCTEDVFVKVLTGEFEFNDEVHERKWLTVTAMNLCKDRLKSWKHKSVAPLDDEPEPAVPEPKDHSDVLEAVQTRGSVKFQIDIQYLAFGTLPAKPLDPLSYRNTHLDKSI